MSRSIYNHVQSENELYSEAVRSFTACNPFDETAAATGELSPRVLAGLLVDIFQNGAGLESSCLFARTKRR